MSMEGRPISRTTAHVSVSLDGYMAGPDQSLDDPLGRGAESLHTWMFTADEPGNEAALAPRAELARPVGAVVMGRNMFGPVRGPWSSWDGDWRGWWGDEPPYHAPVFVLTHHARDPVEMAGGTTFRFVTDGLDAAMHAARAAAGDGDIRIAGGASTIRQALAAGVLDELILDVAPVLLGAGERPLEGAGRLPLQPVDAVASPHATHVTYRPTDRPERSQTP